MSGGKKSAKKDNEDPCKKEPPNCPHEFCHRDFIESDRPIGLPFASGLLQYIPGQEPDPSNLSLRQRLKKEKCLKDKEKETAELIDACPPILENLNTDDPEIEDEMKYLFNFALDAGNEDVGEYIKTFKENMDKAKKEAEEEDKKEGEEKDKKGAEEKDKKEGSEATEGNVAAEENVASEESASPEGTAAGSASPEGTAAGNASPEGTAESADPEGTVAGNVVSAEQEREEPPTT
ncbi:hypothetical protein O3M35_007565 [Rhynocoris fuscipes]|uniref:Uncharacterized protein n=1 Tax=Rhynocoris fuscipes TaxID=488301 RepID=A0AAW1DAQ9_9HEMI